MLLIVLIILSLSILISSKNRNSTRLLQQSESVSQDTLNHNNETSYQNTNKTLVIVLGQTRAYELAFDSFKKNVVEELNADLCLCIGVQPDYNYSNPYYQLAKYAFLYNEPNDTAFAFDFASDIISKQNQSYEKLININGMFGMLLTGPKTSNDNVKYYGTVDEFNQLGFDAGLQFGQIDDDALVIYSNDYEDKAWQNQVYGIHRYNNDISKLVPQNNVITYKKSLNWREFLKIPAYFLGGVKGYNYYSSAAILIFFRWYLLKNLEENSLIAKYDRFVITRSDYIYRLPHPSLSKVLTNDSIWVPDGEKWGGITDRHTVLTRKNVHSYLDILNNMILNSNAYYQQLKNAINTPVHLRNIEFLLNFHVTKYHALPVKFFPYIMYAVKTVSDKTSWSRGVYSKSLGYYVKYESEYVRSKYYFDTYANLSLSYDDFYNGCIESKCELGFASYNKEVDYNRL